MDLDEQERAFTGGVGLAPESGEGLGGLGGTGNVRADGFFSVQVMLEGLKRLTSTHAQPIRSEAARDALAAPTREVGFICNRSEHWFPIRRLGGVWFDLNSMLPTPKVLSETHLQMYLQQNIAEGYTIYVVRGDFPATPFDGGDAGARKAAEAADACRRAEAAGMATQPGGGGAAAPAKPAFDAFSGAGRSLGGEAADAAAAAAAAAAPEIDPELLEAAANDPELAAAIAQSLEHPAPAPAPPAKTAEEERDEMRRKRLARFG